MEVGQPAAGAPAIAIAAVRAALSSGPLGYTEALGIPSLRRRIARAYAEWHGLDIDPERIVDPDDLEFTLAVADTESVLSS